MEVNKRTLSKELRFWTIAGFVQVAVPDVLGSGYAWFEREGTQIHLIAVDEPVVPVKGHAAIVAPELDLTVERLREAGFEVRNGRELWGAARAKAITPGGHTVELMASPPSDSQL
jgi:hypothetical protein